MECNEPLDVLSHKLGIQTVRAGGKESRTVFEKMSFNGKTSVVKCTFIILCIFVSHFRIIYFQITDCFLQVSALFFGAFCLILYLSYILGTYILKFTES